MIEGSKHNQTKARPKDKKKKTRRDEIYILHRKRKKKRQQHNLVLQVTTRNQYTINIPPTI